MKKKTKWMVRTLAPIKPGKAVWVDVKAFTDAMEADNWIYNYCRAHRCSAYDFTVVRMEG